MAAVPKGKSKVLGASGGLDDDLRLRSKSRGLLNTSNLPALQNLLKRDPQGYQDDFVAQWNHYQGLRRILTSDLGAGIDVAAAAAGSVAALGDIGALGVGANGSLGSGMRLSKDEHNQFLSILNFVTHLAPSYPDITTDFTKELSDLLLKHHASLTPDIRVACAKSLVMLCHHGYLKPEELLQTLLPLLSLTTSATLRQFVQKTILMQLKAANLKSKNVALNRQVQTWLFNLMQKGIEAGKIANSGTVVSYGSKGAQAQENMQKSEAMWAVKLAAELWRKSIWRDARTVQIIAEGCFHPNQKVQSSCIRFFLGDLHSSEAHGSDEEGADDSDDDAPAMPDMGKLQHARKVNRKTRGGDRKVRMAAAAAKRLRRKKEEEAGAGAGGDGHFNAVALDLLHDPQTFAEKLFDHMRSNDKRYKVELKVRILQLLSRIISLNSLTVLGFYSYTEKYLRPSQEHVTLILVSLAQAIHEQTPPDVLLPVVRKVSNEFVHPGVGAEVVAAGINTVREICARQPSVMDDAPELLSDLIEYRKSKDKGIIAAARGLLALYREVNPGLLRKAERGKEATIADIAGKDALRETTFGVKKDEVHGIPGLELLVQHLAEVGDDDAGWDGWEVESASDASGDDSDDSGGWIAVSSDEEEGIEISDSDDDEDGDKSAKESKKSTKERAAEWKAKRREDRRRKRAGLPTTADEANDATARSRREQAREEARQLALKAQEEQKAMVELATTRILTPADYVKLDELRLSAAEAAAKGGSVLAKRQLAALKAEAAASKKRSAADEGFLDTGDILGPRKKAKQDYEERKAMREAGREDREKFGSKKGKRNKDNPSSSTNEQKKKGKNFQMIQKSFAVRSKKKESLQAKSRRLRKAHEKEKKRYK